MDSTPRRTRWRWALACLAVFVICAWPWCARRLLATGLLLRIEGPAAGPQFLAQFAVRSVRAEACAAGFPAPCIAYVPAGTPRDGLVLAHGIHAEGIHEPRLVAFAQALASAGFYVVTPLLADLASLRVSAAGAATITSASEALAKQLGRPTVSVFGISFGGGLALRAACEPALRGPIGRVIALGGHSDIVRVARFFLGEPAVGPSGERAEVEPHPYGREVIWRSLFGTAHAGPISVQERALVLAALAEPPAALVDSSPSHCPSPATVPLYLVHGLGDRVVPFTETLWNQRLFGPSADVTILLSPAIAHADYHPPDAIDRLRLVDFMARALF